MFTIYKYTSPENKVYIGCTKRTLKSRAGNLGSGYRTKCRFWDAILKFGWMNFIPEILATTEDPEEASRLELSFILEYQATNPEFGYNTEKVGYNQGKPGYSDIISKATRKGLCSAETRAKMSEAQRQKWSDPDYRASTRLAIKEACNSEEHRKKLSEIGKEVQNRPEVKEKISRALKGLIFINNGFLNKRVSKEEAEVLIASGLWARGRIALGKGSRGPVEKLKGRFWIHKDNQSKFILASELANYQSLGWELGRGSLPRKKVKNL